ncbi:MAG: hypothetical protein FD189_1172 [Elusimicrobia bacterium]|nr:MAG: hypothetical protein FD154_1553 [Elusimicrobiota bacterium]KAF0156027.1 MAG: hypothetical protein FD189_1172 [Elusimicrobiota bacterium]
MKLKALFAAIIFSAAPAWSSEADHYTVPDSEITDITEELNAHAVRLTTGALERLNAAGGCGGAPDLFGRSDEERLYDGLKGVFNIHGRSSLVDDVLDGRMARTVIPLKDSVYRDWDITSGIFLARSQLTLAPNIKVGGLVIGVDKLEHMFGYGRRYFTRHYLKGMEMEKVLALGAAAEKIYLGGNVMATGVFSYSDLSANFNGMRFWNHLLQKRDDILGKEYNRGPYIVCDAGLWKLNPEKPMDLSVYLDRTVQENYNCSKFATESGLAKFTSRLGEYGLRAGDPAAFSCPVSRAALERDAAKYEVPIGKTTIGHWTINRDGSATVSYTDEF